jgi:hypothetical protein
MRCERWREVGRGYCYEGLGRFYFCYYGLLLLVLTAIEDEMLYGEANKGTLGKII